MELKLMERRLLKVLISVEVLVLLGVIVLLWRF